MTECQAAIGRIQLRRLGEWVVARQRNAARLREALADIPGLRLPRPPREVSHAYYRFAVGLPAVDRAVLIGELQRCGVPASAGVCPELYREKALAHYAPGAPLAGARQVADACLFIPVHPTLSSEQIDCMANTVRNTLLSFSDI